MTLFSQSDRTSREPALWKHLGLLIAICLGLWAWTCGLWDLWGPDESRYVQIARELLSRRNWFFLTLHGHPYDQKPPLPFWMLAGMLKLAGGEVHSALVRLPSVFFATLSVVMCCLIGRKLWGARAGLLSALVLLTSVQFLEDAPTAEINIMYTGWTTLALALWYLAPQAERLTWPRAAGFWGAVAGAFFTKGPLTLLIVLSAVAGEAAASRSPRSLLRVRPVAGLLCLLAMIGAWLMLQGQAAGPGFVATQVKGQTLERFLYGSHEAPFWYYLPRLFTSIFLPWGVFLIPAALRLKRLGRQFPAGMGALLGWVSIPFLVLTLANGKRQSYLLPLLPGMALIVGWYLDRLMAEGKTYPRFARGLAIFLMMLGVSMIVAAMIFGIAPALLTRHGLAYHVLGIGMLCFLGAATVGFRAWLRRHEDASALIGVSLTGIMLVFGLLLYSVINPALNPVKTTRPFSLMLSAMAREQKSPQVGAIGRGAKPEYHVYGDYQVSDFEVKQIEMAKADLPSILVGRDSDWGEIQQHTTFEGYRLAWKGEVSRDMLMIYVRR